MLRVDRCLAGIALAWLVQSTPVFAQLKAGPGDWPAWRGANRENVSKETGLLQKWPAGGPKLLWKAEGLGGGWSTPSVYEGQIFLISNKGSDEFLVVLSAEDGAVVRESKVGKVAGVGYPGSRSTPTVDGDKVYTLSSDGDVVCSERASGNVVWTKHLRNDFGGAFGGWGYCESLLVDDETVLCTPGGKTPLVALDKKDGSVRWQANIQGGHSAAYASPIAADFQGTRQYITFLHDGLVSVNAKTGDMLWRYNRTANGTANIPTPIFADGQVFSASGYGTGGALVKLSKSGKAGVTAKEVYFSKEMVNHHGGVVKVGNHLYGTNERTLLCLDFRGGGMKWQNRSVGKGAVTVADNALYVRGENGDVALVAANPSSYKELGRFTQPHRSSQPAWPHPVVAGGRLYLRDQENLLCYNVKK